MKTRIATSILAVAFAAAWTPDPGATGHPRDASNRAGATASPAAYMRAAPQTGSILVGQGIRMCPGPDTVRVDVQLLQTPVPMDAAGLDILYNNATLDWAGYERGPLVASWMFFDAVDLGDRVRVGGFDANAVPAGSSGVFVTLLFVANCCGVSFNNPLCPQAAVDDIASMTPLCGDAMCMWVATRNATWGGVKALYR